MTNYLDVTIDELAIWTTTLTAADATALYRRGANMVQIRARDCTIANCSEYADWSGQTYYSELKQLGRDTAIDQRGNHGQTLFPVQDRI